MAHPLESRVQVVRRRAIGLVRAHGVSLLLIATIAILVGFGLVDYLLRLHDPAARWMLSLAALGAILWAAWKLAIPAFRYRLGLIPTAQRIQWYYPQLGERLSTAVAFLGQDECDPTAGSIELRRAVVAETEALAAPLDFRLAIDGRRPRWARFAACALALVIAALAMLDDGQAAGLALARLAMPWKSDLAWPRRHSLEFVRRPDKIAAGDDFEVELVDRGGELPERVEMQLRFATPTGTRTETKPMKPLADRMVFRLDNVTQPLAYRARGGDDDTMPWTELAVVEPPKVLSLDVTVQPPAYTARPPLQAGRVVRMIEGSALAIRGKVDKPIVSATLRSDSPGLQLPQVQISPDGLRFAVPAGQAPAGQFPAGNAPWQVEKSTAVWVELADASGLPTGRDTRVEVQVVADSPPAISWQSPADHTFVTARALVNIKALVKDDVAIQNVQLRYLRPGFSDQPEQVVLLYVGPNPPEPAGSTDEGESRSIDFAWDLAQLAGLQPGDVLAVRLTAEDYKPQLATSVARRLTVITEEELASRLGQRQSSILGQLAEALRIQRDCREQLSAVQFRLDEAGMLDETDLSRLQSVQLNQRQVGKLLGTAPDGVEGQILALLAELEANRIAGQAIPQRMNDLLGKVRLISGEPLVEINAQLTEAFKSVRQRIDSGGVGAGAEAGAGDSLRAAAVRQDEVIESLEALLGVLTEWDSFSRLAREIGQIRGDQQRLADETEALRLRAIAAEQLPAEDRAAARQLSQQELELARRLDKIQSRMGEMLSRLQNTDPLAAGTLADALNAARRLAIGGQLRDAAAKLSQQQFGQSRAAQAAALDGLGQLLDLLSSRREDELARTIKSLRAAGGEIAGLLARQQAVQAEIAAAAALAEPDEQRRQLQRLTRQLVQLADEIDPLA
ncbi:MAG: hypothetical protein WD872_06735, partial [Pirellulaceae bacterium]